MIDVTESMQAERKLKESENKLKALFDSANDGIFIIDKKSKRILSVNSKVTDQLGYTEDELVGKPIYKLYCKKDLPTIKKNIEQLMKEGRVIFEAQQIRKDGSLVDVEVSSKVFVYKGREVFQSFVRDITERKQANDELLQTNVRMETVLHTIQNGVFVIDAKTHEIIEVNTAAEKMIGATSEEIVGHVCHKFVCPAQKGACPITDKGLLVDNSERVLLGKDGRQIDIIKTVTSVTLDGRECLLESFMDITKLKQAERRIEHLNLVLKAIRNVNQLIVKEKDRDRLIKGVCENLIETRGYYYAWIALLDESGKFISAESVGLDQDFSSIIKILKSGKTTECVNKALKISDVVIFQDSATECKDCPLSKKHTSMGRMVIRLEHEGKIYGVMTVSIPVELIKDKEEHNLVEEVAEDIAYALHGIEIEKERKRAKETLQESEKKFKTLAEESPNMIFINKMGKIGYVNKKSEQIMGYKQEEFYASDFDFMSIIAPEYKELVKLNYANHMKGEEVNPYEYALITREGKRIEAIITSKLIDFEDEKAILGIVTDITDRIEAEEKLNESEQRFKQIADSAGEWIWEVDAEGMYTYSSPVIEKILGYRPEEVVGKKHFYDFFRPDEIKELKKEAFSVFKMKESFTGFINTNIHKDGHTVILETSGVPIFDENGKLLGYRGADTDITKRKQTEEEKEEFITELMDREEKFRTLTYNLNVGVYRSTPGKNGKVIEANPAFLKMFGFRSKDELERWKVVDFYPDPEERKNVEEKLVAKGFLINEEIMLRKKDGTIFIASISTTVAKDESGKVTHYDGIIEDITERKKAEVQLKESHDNYATIFNGAIDGIIYSDWKGKILAVNSIFTDLIGIKKADLIGKNGIQLIKELAPKKFTVETLDFIRKVLRGDAVKGFPIEYNNRTLEYYTPEQKGKRGITIMVRDVTERNKANKKIELHKKYQEALSNELIITEERAKRRLAITLHDKLGQSLVLANFKSSELNKKIKNAEHKKLIDEITGFLEEAISESRNITYELSPPVLYEMGLVPAISLKLDDIEKDNKIKTLLLDQSKSYEFEEKVQIILFRTISELLQNVIKHSKAENVNVSFRRSNGSYRITVSDNGIGFNVETEKEKAISEKKFGLFSIIERIRFIGGDLKIDSTPNKGTEVVIILPLINK